ncbi:ATP-binding protein [Streptomyces sp. NA04227]|uniref:ATP-binding protein n=1 Tax=Streptomyces sp. NA04227 TaxID=2742136 RepID=UPI0015917039|nr:ATP-binding protein [Streptomyces sp. NA04227]QKW10020.1 ATP-binding protein [Streptomyces sp. NA04227]
MTRQIRGAGSTGRQGGRPHLPRPGGTARTDGRAELVRTLRRADLRAVPGVRREIRELVSGWGKSATADTAELLTSELVTNALVHTEGDAVLTVRLEAHQLRVEVRDFARRRPEPRAARADHDTNGRGLHLVRSLARSWGVDPDGQGKTVWFELRDES